MSQIYVDAAKVVSRVVDEKRGMGSSFANNAVFALASNTIRFHDVLLEGEHVLLIDHCFVLFGFVPDLDSCVSCVVQ
jgi:hypothetical protein